MNRGIGLVASLVGLTLLVIVNVLPIVWGILTSFKHDADLTSYPPKIFAFATTLDHYARVFAADFGRSFANSLFYSVVAVTATLVLGLLGAFAFDRYKFPMKSGLFLLIVASIPLASGAAALLVPNYLFFTTVGLTNGWYTLPIVYTAYMIPMTIWILKGALEGVPRELDEAAAIDGASPLRILFMIVLPLVKPAIGAAGLFIFLHCWNEFVAGSVLVDRQNLRPVQVAVYQFIGFFGREWGPLTAAATLATLPIYVVYLFFGRLLVSGLTSGAVK